MNLFFWLQPNESPYKVYYTFQSHEPEFDYLKSLEIEEKINKIKWLKRLNASNFLLSTNDKTIKLWKIVEKDKRIDGYNLKDESGTLITPPPAPLSYLTVPQLRPAGEVSVDHLARKTYANAHTYHINSISVNSDGETFLSADDLRINLWHLDITDESFSKCCATFPPTHLTLTDHWTLCVTDIVDIKPANMEELTEVITAAEFHPRECNLFVYSSSKGILRLCDMRQSALCDQHAKSEYQVCFALTLLTHSRRLTLIRPGWELNPFVTRCDY